MVGRNALVQIRVSFASRMQKSPRSGDSDSTQIFASLAELFDPKGWSGEGPWCRCVVHLLHGLKRFQGMRTLMLLCFVIRWWSCLSRKDGPAKGLSADACFLHFADTNESKVGGLGVGSPSRLNNIL